MINSSMDSPKEAQGRSTTRGAYNPLTRQDVQPSQESSLFAGLESTSSRTMAGLLFAVIFVLSEGLLQFSGLLMVVLLVCLLYRMDARERRIAAVPLVFGATRLALGITAQFQESLFATFTARPAPNSAAFLGSLHWMPLLFAVYLFYSPWKDSHTSRIVFWYSAILLLSGLLPGDGYLCVLYAAFYTLFFAVTVALILDFANGNPAERPRPLAPPPQPEPAPQPAFS